MLKRLNNAIYLYSLTVNSTSLLDSDLLSESEFEKILKLLCKSYVYSKEAGSKNGRLHYQAVISLNQRTRNPIRAFAEHVPKEDLPFWHFCPCSNINALKRYVAKQPIGVVREYSRQFAAPNVFNEIILRHCQLGMLEILEEKADARSIFIFSSAGNLGKTTMIKYLINKHPTVVAPSVGTLDSAAQAITKRLQIYNADPGVQKIYLCWDVTRTSPLLNKKEKKIQLFSICESTVSGLLVSAFGGQLNSYYAAAGKAIPIIFTNADLSEFDDMVSLDREQYYKWNPIKRIWEHPK